MTNESYINLINFQQKLQNLCKNEEKNLAKEIFSLKFKILLLLFSHKSASPSMIKNEFILAKSNVTKFCKSLENEGKIDLSEDKKDRRAIHYSLTKSGEKYVVDTLAEFSKILATHFSSSTLQKMEKSLANLFDAISEKKGEFNAKNY